MTKQILLITFVLIFSWLGKESLEADQIAYVRRGHPFFVRENAEPILQWAQNHLSQIGTLKEGSGGFVYLKVDDGYINQLYPFLPTAEYIKPPYFRRADSPGAHISVFYEDERNATGPIAEIGKQFSFKPFALSVVPPWSQEYIVLDVKSSELEQLRQKYGLTPLLKGHQFHITLAKKRWWPYR